MKIRTQFIITTVIFGMILLFLSTLVIVTNERVQQTQEQEKIARTLEQEANELSYLSNAYLLYHESQQLNRWEAKFSSFAENVKGLNPETPEQEVLVNNILTSQARLNAVVAEVRAAIEGDPQARNTSTDPDFVQVAWSRMEVQNQGMIFNASRVAQTFGSQADRMLHARSLLMYVMIGVFGTFILANYFLTSRRTLRSISLLKAGTEIIGSGNQDHAIEAKRKDEIGDLSRAFNRMTASLKSVTASKSALENEIAERRKAEAALRESEQKYRGLFDNMTEGFAHCKMIFDEEGCPQDFVYLTVNNAFSGLTGLKNVVGKRVTEVIPGIMETQRELLETYGRVASTGQPENIEVDFKPLGMWLSISLFSTETGYFVAVFQNITERKKAEAEVSHKASFPELNPQPIVEMDADGNVQYINPMARTVLPDMAALGASHPFVAGWESLFNTLRGDQPRSSMRETQVGDIWYDQAVAYIPVTQTLRFYGRNITERRKAEDALRESEEKFRTLFDHMTEGFALTEVISDAEGKPYDFRRVEINKAAERILGRSNLGGKTMRETISDPFWLEAYGRVALTGEPAHFERYVPSLDKWLEVDAFSPREGYVARVFRDITARKRTEEALRESEEKFRSLFDHMTEGFALSEVILDADGKPYDYRWLEANKAWYEIVGRPPGEIVGKTHRQLDGPNADLWWIEVYGKVALTGEPIHIERYSPALNKWLEIDAYSPRKGYVARTLRDITAREKAAEALSLRTLELEAANKELESFSYSVSHDLRAPLRVMDGFSQAVLEDYADKLDDQGRDYLIRIRASSQLMARLIDDMLGLSRVVRSDLRITRVNLSEIASMVVERLRTAYPDRRADFVITPGVEAVGDAGLLGLVMENLLGNALKFTAGRENARIEFGMTEEDGRKLYYVSDNGAGFDMTYVDKLFKPFQRLHSNLDYPGTGIGLATVQRIIHRHGGRVRADGQPGKGATFYFTLGREKGCNEAISFQP